MPIWEPISSVLPIWLRHKLTCTERSNWWKFFWHNWLLEIKITAIKWSTLDPFFYQQRRWIEWKKEFFLKKYFFKSLLLLSFCVVKMKVFMLQERWLVLDWRFGFFSPMCSILYILHVFPGDFFPPWHKQDVAIVE